MGYSRRQRFGDGVSRLPRLEFSREFVTTVRLAGAQRSVRPAEEGRRGETRSPTAATAPPNGEARVRGSERQGFAAEPPVRGRRTDQTAATPTREPGTAEPAFQDRRTDQPAATPTREPGAPGSAQPDDRRSPAQAHGHTDVAAARRAPARAARAGDTPETRRPML